MKSVIRGNFTPVKDVTVGEERPTLESQFQREALKRLGGSIAFVSNKNFLWSGDEKDQPATAEPEKPSADRGEKGQ